MLPGVAGDARSRQQLGQRRHEHQRVDERVHAVERPAAPRGPEAADLIRRQRRRARTCRRRRWSSCAREYTRAEHLSRHACAPRAPRNARRHPADAGARRTRCASAATPWHSSAPSNFVEWIQRARFRGGVERHRRRGGAAGAGRRSALAALADASPRRADRRAVRAVARASEGADLIVGAGVQMAAASVAEWRDVPCASVVFCPCAMPSSAAPPPPIRTQTLPRWVNRLLWDVGGPVAVVGAAQRRSTAAARRSACRRSTTPLTHLVGDRVIVAADRDLAPLGDDAPARAVATDAWILDEAATRSIRALDAFLNLRSGAGLRRLRQHGGRAGARARGARHRRRRAPSAAPRSSPADGPASIATSTPADDLLIDRRRAASRGLSARRRHRPPRRRRHDDGGGSAGVPQVILPHILDQYLLGASHRAARPRARVRCRSISSPPTSWPIASTPRSTIAAHPRARRGARAGDRARETARRRPSMSSSALVGGDRRDASA